MNEEGLRLLAFVQDYRRQFNRQVQHINPEGLNVNPAFTNTVTVVSGLANPEFLCELDAIAVVPL
jgi:hypothetical protein